MKEAQAQFIRVFFPSFWQAQSRPLVVGEVLGSEFAQEFSESGVLANSQEALYERVFYKANDCVRTEVPWPHRDVSILSVAAHDLISLADPKLSGRKRRKCLPLLEQTLATLPRIERYDQLAVRWAALEQLDRCVRRDTTVRFWIGKRTFRGRDAPKRILIFPRLRRVRTSSENVFLREVWPKELENALDLFWSASPLSWLCHAHRWNDHAVRPDDVLLDVALRDPAMRAFVAEQQRAQDLSWIRWLLASAKSERLKYALYKLVLDLRAMGAEDPVLSALLTNVPVRDLNLFDQRLARPLFDDSPSPEPTELPR